MSTQAPKPRTNNHQLVHVTQTHERTAYLINPKHTTTFSYEQLIFFVRVRAFKKNLKPIYLCPNYNQSLNSRHIVIGDQLRLILPILGGHSSNLPIRVLVSSILPIGWGYPSILPTARGNSSIVPMGWGHPSIVPTVQSRGGTVQYSYCT